MTAMSIVVQQRAGAAFLLTDTGVYDTAGTVVVFTPKVRQLHVGKRLSVAFANSGMGGADELMAAALRSCRANNLHELASAFKAAFLAAEDELVARRAAHGNGRSYMSAALAVFDHGSGRPAGFVIGNSFGMFPAEPHRPPYKPRNVQPVTKYLTEYAGRPFPAGTDVCNPARWNPDRDAAALFQAQRHHPFGDEAAPFCGVGGRAMLTRVDAAGVHNRTVLRWPDRVGRRIDPNAIGRPPCPPIEAAKALASRAFARIAAALPSLAPTGPL